MLAWLTVCLLQKYILNTHTHLLKKYIPLPTIILVHFVQLPHSRMISITNLTEHPVENKSSLKLFLVVEVSVAVVHVSVFVHSLPIGQRDGRDVLAQCFLIGRVACQHLQQIFLSKLFLI